MINFKGKKIAVIGLGLEGLSSALFLAKRGASVFVLDQKEEKDLDQEFLKILREKDIKIISGKNYLDNLNKFDLIVRSPGVNIDKIQNSKLKSQNSIITSQTKLFFDLCPCPIIGVTGTKGKGTTSALIYEMLQKHGINAYLGGNIGKPPLDFLDKLSEQSASRQGGSVVVLELSSFQLQDFTQSPHIAVMLMMTSEHLDYHKDTKEYVDAKRNILKFQTKDDYVILNKDYPASRESDIHTDAKMFYISRDNKVEEGCFVEDGKIFLSLLNGVGVATRMGNVRRKTSNNTGSDNVKRETIIDIRDILLPGEHNLENVCAAVMAALLCGVSKENIVKVLKTFKGLEHRLELVSNINGVRFYDDSFSTIPETTIAAIQAFKDPEILILGGSSKNSDFSELGRVIRDSKNVKAIIGIGVEWPRIKKRITNNELLITIVEGLRDMHSIVQKAYKLAKPGDVVLLSPACASFDMFKNYKDRGDQFKKEVRRLA
ncbi:MAG: UDP-N-acetylmuramoylalanine--D-glutamate ligase [Candidatus Levybacteria bacterium RIFCSPLOWO2_01_FULL_38_13]|nr:MAG: UDP-N-acetylmuramoylalanine--D-glutamate ligase [Candidatus Levybacteria bacterium RIFCSPHIGHO2_01_FULL_41_15]OGH34643.1 MAG: UDP-N-acetylmuramoylalanine--D-glutamate ligase [Candidatus Levybacteria bacterium RIFCSPLOWO2_01_FULL_38_13]